MDQIACFSFIPFEGTHRARSREAGPGFDAPGAASGACVKAPTDSHDGDGKIGVDDE